MVCGPEEGILDLWSWRLTSKRNTKRKKGLLCLFLVHAWPVPLANYRGRKGSQAARGTPSYLLRFLPPSKLSYHLETVPNYNQMQSLLKALRSPELFVEVFDKTSNIAPRNPTADPHRPLCLQDLLFCLPSTRKCLELSLSQSVKALSWQIARSGEIKPSGLIP